jgi:phosphatidylglycerol:prolipoprotein diacylglycerol transferase
VIPEEVADVPLLGVGILLAVWAVASIVLLAWLVKRQGLSADTLGYLPLLGTIGLVIWLVPRVFPGGLPIRGYGVMLLLAGVSGVALSVYRARRVGLSSEIVIALAFWVFVAGIVGARLFHVIEYWETQYRSDTIGETLRQVINIPQGGLVVYGSLIGGVVAFALFVRRHKLPALALADLVAPSLALGLAIGRIGCLLNGCCFGGYCELPWAVTFPADSPPYESQMVRGSAYGFQLQSAAEGPPEIAMVLPGSPAERAGLEPGERLARVDKVEVQTSGHAQFIIAQRLREGGSLTVETASGGSHTLAAALPARSLPVHPTQIYSAINAAVLCLFLWAYYPFRQHEGEVTALMLSIYPVTRFLLEIIRVDESAVFRTGLSISQNVSLLMLAAVVPLWWYVLRRPAQLVFSPRAK